MGRLFGVVAGAAMLAACATTAPAQIAADDGDDPWRADGAAALEARLGRGVNHARAKNVIIFVADGASPTFFTAARIHDGQRLGQIGDLHDAPPDTFPHTALARTHSADDRVPDSAATATAIFTGVKTHNSGVGVVAGVRDCAGVREGARSSLGEIARASGRRVGVVTTATVTDATPAAVFAHAPTRGWQDPRAMPEADRAAGCLDIPEQLIAADLDVAMGGGQVLFVSDSAGGVRSDGRNLVEEWLGGGAGRAFAGDADGLAAVDAARTERLLALLSPGEMFEDKIAEPPAGVGPTTTPLLVDMVEVALDVLERDDRGYFLMIEQEGTDELQHAGYLGLALDAGAELYDAVRLVLGRVDLSETLVIVTADHGQPLAMGGGGPLESPLLGLASYQGRVSQARDGAPYAQLGFYAGPKARVADPGLSSEDIADRSYIPDAGAPIGVVPHSGVDVPVYATGPWSDLFAGVIQQNAIFSFVRHAMEPGE
jgi:alkaline phosphatase